jgi:RND family efflux transporter MFP subunit
LFWFAVIPLTADEAEYGALPVKVVLFPFREAILSTQIDGVISKYNFRGGERFKRKDVLLTLDDQKYRNELLRAESLLRESTLNVNFMKQKLTDNERLFKNDIQSEIEVVRSKFDYSVAVERQQAAMINRDDAALHLLFCTILAPFDGTVEKLLTREYETVRSGQLLLSIIDDNQLLAVMNLPSKQLTTVYIGMPATVKIMENGKNVTGDIYEIASRADHRSETFEIKVRFDNRKHLFKAGMSGVLVKIGGGNGQ